MPIWNRRLSFGLGRELNKVPTRGTRRTFVAYTQHRYETVVVPCGSSGNIDVDLHNVSSHPPDTPLLIYLPPFSRSPGQLPALLPFAARYPTAVIRYRWPEDSLSENHIPAGRRQQEPRDGGPEPASNVTPLHWPTPIHDILFGYEWLVRNLAPEGRARRNVYVYGSYLGASLAAALALTESHTHQRMAVRGVALYNGIYNWTTFLPDHPINHPTPTRRTGLMDVLAATARWQDDLEAAHAREAADEEDAGSTFHYIKQLTPTLFKTPSNLFDPFASPCFFFHSTGMLVPPSFDRSALSTAEGSAGEEGAAGPLPQALLEAVSELSLNGERSPHRLLGGGGADDPESACLETAYKAPRKGYLTFPPRQSSLRIPEALIMHDTALPLHAAGRRRPRSSSSSAGGRRAGRNHFLRNSFAAQAAELAGLMRRSVNLLELKERRKWDHEFDDWEVEAERRVVLRDVGGLEERDGWLGKQGEEAVGRWLEDKMGF